MSNTDVIHNYAVREIVALFHERNPTRPDDATDDTPNTTTEDAEANILDHHVPSPSPNVFDDIPKADATYRAISTNLLPHTRIPGMFLLEYRTFGGALAYQPCSKDIDLMGVFKALHPLDRNGDRLFKVAREWSCIVQALPGLPKEIRWVLATIYNFANEMLRPEHDEAALWRKRPWLLYWYTVADKLFEAYEIFATSPDADWFLRPTPVILKQEMSRETAHLGYH
ncbi:hypothetical protein QQX98_008905 [Neonectria punicea]|uniref:Uncharacterized protein n=1 Tax=Neonectria punicea TaxID=979145 RepID=A0ABR1GTR9_9HYPO